MDFKKALSGVLSKLYKVETGEIDALFDASDTTEESVINKILELDKARVAKFSGKMDEGHKKGKAEALKAFEADIRKKYEYEDEDPENPLKGLDLLEAILAKATEGKDGKDGKEGKGKLTDDDIKKSPVYQKLEKDMKKALKDAQTERETEVTGLKTQYEKEKSFSAVGSKALDILDGLNPILPVDPKVAKKHRAVFVDALKQFEYQINDNGIVVMKDGKVLDDGHGYSKDFDGLVKDLAAEHFEFKQNNGGSNSGNNNDKNRQQQGGGAGKYPAGITKPKTLAEYTTIISNRDLPMADRKEVQRVWAEENAAKTE